MADGIAPGFAGLDPCVHCGFCLPACPTYLATGDESSSPRGRIVLMRALERGEMDPRDEGLRQHLSECLGCRGCEPVCPSGVAYGQGLEAARIRIADAAGIGLRTRLALGLFGSPTRWRPAFAVGRWLRRAGLARLGSGRSRPGMVFGMLAASEPAFRANGDPRARTSRPAGPETGGRGSARVALFRGCVMDGLFGHVHDATRRTLEVNGYEVVEVSGQACCGALHAHAGDTAGAARLARANVAALAGRADAVVVNSAGCGAMLKEYRHHDAGPDAARFAETVRDVTELLAARGPRPGAPLDVRVAYDPPCHLQHAQQVHEEALAVLGAIPELDLRLLPGAERCCGAAGIYGVLHPALSGLVLDAKLDAIMQASPPVDVVATGNPGCLMQIGAGLLARGARARVAHPVELLDRSYREAGYY